MAIGRRILFVENRYRTYFWEEMANRLEKDGHEIYFIVENHAFVPKRKNVYVIPYPVRKNLNEINSRIEFEKIKCSDRAINYFELTSSNHYEYYYEQIKAYIIKIKPDIVFGESTAFHELLTIEICKGDNILYLHPSSCRYPVGRFSFYKYDTLEPYGGSEEVLSEMNAMEIVNNIVRRAIVPDYMKKKKVKFSTRYARLKELIKLTLAYYGGERYDTPSPIVKYFLEKRKKRNILRWNELANNQFKKIELSVFKILYPLQMQPEANLDVWGRKRNNQLQVIKNIIQETDERIYLVVKPNPKSKYELSSELIDYIQQEERIIVVHHNVRMNEIIPKVDMVITVTGTITMECIWANKPVVTLVRTLYNDVANAIFLEKFNDLQLCIDMVRKNEFPCIDDKQKVAFLNRITRTSFAGMPYEINMDENNLEQCKIAFEKVLQV